MADPNEALAPSYQRLIAQLARRSDEFGAAVLTELINAHPVYWGWFPPNRETVAHALGRALTHVLSAQAEHHGMTRATHRFLRHLAEDHRSFGVESEHYEDFGPAITAAMRRLVPDVDSADLALFQMAVATIVSTMARAAEDFRNVMVRWPATVKEIRRCGPSTMIVRVAVDHGPVPFQPGQFAPLSLPQMRGRRVFATPCDLGGSAGGARMPGVDDALERPQDLEFHLALSRVGQQTSIPRPGERVSEHLLRMTRPGDTWEIGIPRGEITAAAVLDAATVATVADVDLLLVCDSAGWITHRVLILENMATAQPRRIHVIWAADNPAELYDLRWLWGMASAFDWLSFDAVVRSEKLPRFTTLPPEASAPVTLASWWTLPDFIRHRVQLDPNPSRHDPRRLTMVGGIAVVAGEEATMRPIAELLAGAGLAEVFMD